VAKLQVDSPDTVQFDEETRNLYQSIGEKFRLKAGWNAWTDDLVIQLKEGEEVQSAGTRETTQWMWETSSESDSAKQLSFVAHIINEDDHPVLLCRQDFEIASSGLISGITTSFSISSLLIGVLIGFVGVGILVAARSNKSNGKVQQRRPLNKQVRKEL
jgi:hypothetical protein